MTSSCSLQNSCAADDVTASSSSPRRSKSGMSNKIGMLFSPRPLACRQKCARSSISSPTAPLWKAIQTIITTNDTRSRRESRRDTTLSPRTDEDADKDSFTEVSSSSEDDEVQENSSKAASPSSSLSNHYPLRSCLSSSSSNTTIGVEKKKEVVLKNKSVQFKRHARMKYTLPLQKYTQEELASTWYSQSELDVIKKDYTKEKRIHRSQTAILWL